MKKWLLLILISVVGVLAACSAEPTKEENGKGDVKLRIGYTSVYSMLGVAVEQGFLEEEFKDDDIDIEYVQFLSGPPLTEAIAGGHLEFGQIGAQPAVQAVANGIELSVVGVYAFGEEAVGLVVPENSSIQSVEQIKGKKIGVTAGSLGHRLLNEYLKKHNFKTSDIEQINLQPADLKNALAQGDIDAAILYEPWISTAEVEKAGEQIASAEGLFNDYAYYVAANEFAEAHPEILERLLAVLHKAEEWSKEHPAETINDLNAFFGTQKEILELALPRREYDIELTEEAQEALQETIDDLAESKVIRKKVALDDIMKTEYLDNISKGD